MKLLPLLSMLAVIVAGGLIHGLWNDRWQRPQDLTEAVARLHDVPKEIGSWTGVDAEIDAKELEAARIEGHVFRQYSTPGSRTEPPLDVSVLLVCGRGGPISVHTPDVCYQGLGYQVAGSPERIQLQADDAKSAAVLWSSVFERSTGTMTTSQLRFVWTWNAGDGWQAPNSPRRHFAGQTALFKLYVFREKGANEKGRAEEAFQDFIRRLLSTLDRTLFREAVNR